MKKDETSFLDQFMYWWGNGKKDEDLPSDDSYLELCFNEEDLQFLRDEGVLSNNQDSGIAEYEFEQPRPDDVHPFYGVNIRSQTGAWKDRMIEIWCYDYSYLLFDRGCAIVTKDRLIAIDYAEQWSKKNGLPVRKKIIDIYALG